jgi:hypothetical protein
MRVPHLLLVIFITTIGMALVVTNSSLCSRTKHVLIKIFCFYGSGEDDGKMSVGCTIFLRI